jgi:hypothetical protein
MSQRSCLIARRPARTTAIVLSAAAMLAAVGTAANPLAAQTDYYNTDARRPVRIEDAYPVERYAFEAQVAPLRLERLSGGVYHWEIEPELAYGILPRTHLEVGLPLIWADGADDDESFGVGGTASPSTRPFPCAPLWSSRMSSWSSRSTKRRSCSGRRSWEPAISWTPSSPSTPAWVVG